jgi:hypothetical protein
MQNARGHAVWRNQSAPLDDKDDKDDYIIPSICYKLLEQLQMKMLCLSKSAILRTNQLNL